MKREIAKFFGVDMASEERERVKWSERQKRLALRRFGSLKQVLIGAFASSHLESHLKRMNSLKLIPF